MPTSGASSVEARLYLTQPTRIDPLRVRFSQRSISPRFRDGRSIEDLADGLRSGRVVPAEVPPIPLMERGGMLYTLDNRRLEAFRRAGVDVPYIMAGPRDVSIFSRRFTTQNEGTSVVVRGAP